MKIKKYNKSIVDSYPNYDNYKNQINEYGIDGFLKYRGIFVEIFPFRRHPDEGGKLIGLNIDIEYQTERINEDKWKTKIYKDRDCYKTEEDASTKAILKSFKIIEERGF